MAVPSALLILMTLLAAARQRRPRPSRAAGVPSPDRAIPLALDEPARDAQFDSLLRRGVIVRSGPGRYSLDPTALARAGQGRPRTRAALLLAALVGLVGGAALVLRRA